MKKIGIWRFLVMIIVLFPGCAAYEVRHAGDEINSVISLMNQAYRLKEIDVFMEHVSQNYDGDRMDLKISVENDFAAFVSIDYTTTIVDVVENEETHLYYVKVIYFRQVTSARFGNDNRNDETTLVFEKDGETYKLVSMPSPRLYGLIYP